MLDDGSSFIIISDGRDITTLERCVESIYSLKMNIFEIILVGPTFLEKLSLQSKTRLVPFDDEIKAGWITRKKNIGIQNAKHQRVVIMHDYFALSGDWLKDLSLLDLRADVLVPRISKSNGERFRDWVLWWENGRVFDGLIERTRWGLVPYWCSLLTEYQYVSGGIWASTKKFMSEYPLDEELCWGQGEDVEWSLRIRSRGRLVCARSAKAVTMREKPASFKKIPLFLLCFLCTYALVGKLRKCSFPFR
jgi:hypothetical protein